MRETTTLYKSIMSGIHRYEVKLDIAGTEYGMSDLVTLKTNVAAFSNDGPQLGLAVAQEISVDVYADSADIPRMAELKPYYRVINDSRQSEWIQKGVFYLDTREQSSSGIMHLTGFDNMLKAEALYPGSTLIWPATDIDVVREIAGFMNVTIDARTIAIMTSGYKVQLAPQMTMREMLQYIAAMYGGSFIFSDVGELLLVCVWNIDDSNPYTIVMHGISQTIRPEFPACTGVRFIVNQTATEQTEVFSGDETGYVYEIQCPFATQAIADSLLAKMQGMVYRPYASEKVDADPALEIGDAVTLGINNVTSSDNLISYPLYSTSNWTQGGITYKYEDDGSITITGSRTTTGNTGTTITNELTLAEESTVVTIIVEVPLDFPEKTENNVSWSFSGTAITDTSGDSGYQLNRVITTSEKKLIYYTFSKSEAIKKVKVSINYGGAGERIYNGNVRIMVVSGSSVVPWQAPVGARTKTVSGIYSFDMNFNSACRPTLAAPGELEIDHEYSHENANVRIFKRIQRDVQAKITLLDDKITLAVEDLEYTVTESDNLLSFPLKTDTPESFEQDGVTFTYRRDGSVKVEGTYTGTNNAKVYFTDGNNPTGTYRNVSVRTSKDFPTISTSPFIVKYTYNDNPNYTVYLNSFLDDGDDRTYYAVLGSTSTALSLGVAMKNGETYDYVMYPEIMATEDSSATPERWEQPVGSTGNSVDNKVDKGTVSTEISLERDAVNISGNRLTVNSTNFKVSGSGEVDITGKLTTTSGNRQTVVDAGEMTLTLGAVETGAVRPNTYSYYNQHYGVTRGPYNVGEFSSTSQGLLVKANESELFLYGDSTVDQTITGAEVAHLLGGGFYVDRLITPRLDVYLPGGSGSGRYASFERSGNNLVDFDESLYVEGNLGCGGSKPRIVRTDNYGAVAMTAMESTYSVFSDLGSGAVDEYGVCYVFFDPDFVETIDETHDYQVFTTQTSEGGISWVEKQADGFIVHGTPNTSFDWIVYARQKSYSDDRMEQWEIPDPKVEEPPYEFTGDNGAAAAITEEYMDQFEYDYDDMADDYLDFEGDVEEL